MTRTELLAAFRARAFDQVAPYLWADAEVLEFLDDAINEACERALLIRDAFTPAVCVVPIVAGAFNYALHASIIDVLRAKLDSQGHVLNLLSTAAIDERPILRSHTQLAGTAMGWERLEGTPSTLLVDAQGSGWNGRLVPRPTAIDTLRLTVHRRPLSLLSAGAGTDSPEIAAHLHIRLLDWMAYRAYDKKDAETADQNKAGNASAAFTSAFGERVDVNRRRTQRDRAAGVTRFREF